MPRERRVVTVPAALLPWLGPARRRARVRRLLEAALWGLGANLLLLAVLEVASRVFRRRLFTPDIGLLLFAVLALRAVSRENFATAALLLDRRLDLKDRLASAIDFHGRAEVDVSFRQAQLEETLQALAGRRGASEPRIPRYLWTAPILFALYILFSFTYPFGPLPTVREGSRTAGPVRRADHASSARDSGRTLSRGGEGRDGAGELPAEQPGGSQPEKAGTSVAAQAGAPVAPHPVMKDERARPAGAKRDAAHAGVGTGVIPEPAQLFSETVSKALTPVGPPRGKPVEQSGHVVEPAPPHGGVTFNLLSVPGRAPGPVGFGKGETGGAAPPFEVTVDFDRVPAELRECVRRYFQSLQGTGIGGSRGSEG